jgi:hypothetical protein
MFSIPNQKSIFPAKSSFNLKLINSHLYFISNREKPSITNQDTSGKTVTHDFLVYSNHQELGLGKLKLVVVKGSKKKTERVWESD